MLANEPDLATRVTAAVRVGGRRWNLRIDGKIDVLLPAEDPEGAIAAARSPRAVERDPRSRCAGGRYAAARPARGAGLAAGGKGSGTGARQGPPAGTEHMTATAPARAQAQGPAAATTADDKARPRRAPIRPRGSPIAALDIGTTKVCCFIARVEADTPRVLGIGHQISRGVRGGADRRSRSGRRFDRQCGSRRRADGRRDDRAGRRQSVGRLFRLAHHQGRDRHRRARDRRRRAAAGARSRLSAARARRPPDHPFGPGRLLDRRQPRHPRPARHVRRAARRQHERGDRARRRRAQSQRGDRPLRISRSTRWSSALRRRPLLPRRGRDRARRHRHRHGRRHHDDRRVLRRQSDLRRFRAGRRRPRDQRHRPRPVDRRSPMPSA